MADTKITALTALTGANLATGDQAVVVDVSDTTLAASGTDKKMSASELAAGMFLLQDGKAVSRHLPTGALSATFDRAITGSANTNVLTSGTLNMVAIDLEAGQVITSISVKSGGVAMATGTHQFFGIADSTRAVQRWTSDDTNTAWGATTVKTLNLTSTYTVPSTGLYYIAIMVAATTVPNLLAMPTVSVNLTNIAPILAGNTSDTGLTTPPTIPFTAGAITAATVVPYAWVS